MLAFRHKHVKQPLKFGGKLKVRDENGYDPYKSEEYAKLQNKSEWEPLALPCGGCIHCRLQRSQEKAVRAIHQSKTSPTGDNCFLTLTYSDNHLPYSDRGYPIYDVSHVKGFMDDLRDNLRYQFLKRTGSKTIPDPYKIKSFGCAEYGENFERPHYHLCLFNYDFPDKKFHQYRSNDWSSQEWMTWRSELLEKLWPYGHSEIGSLTEESAAYVARYVVKKISGKNSAEHYDGRPPERIVCNSQGIGLQWLKKYADEILNNDSVMFKFNEVKIPRYYEKKLEQLYPLRYVTLKQSRLEGIREKDLDSTKARLKDREEVHEARAKQLKRGYE